ncbi:hypothetical protein Daus18300_003165 [Diaporthe australafricana]|uniref:Uncharacterized protein n=1 Tax=Diaporthe australafricana TaxID=127596 RepID=A0ABR3XI94_9PEZI
MSYEVVPADGGYKHYFFAFTPKCVRFQEGEPCRKYEFGFKSLSAEPGFIPDDCIDDSHLSKQIIKSVGSAIHDHAEIHGGTKAVRRTQAPVARFIVLCPPGICAITTAVHLCRANENAFTEWLVRIDHRLRCACYKSPSEALGRLSMIADTIADVGSGNHWANPRSPEAQWIKYIDRAWLEANVYYADDASHEKIRGSVPMTHPDDVDWEDMRLLLSLNVISAEEDTVAVILADVDSDSWIIDAEPFPAVERNARVGEMFHMMFENNEWKRSFMGTFETKGTERRRRVGSVPPEEDEY